MWLEYVRALWPVVVGLAMLFSAIVGLWLASKFASKSSVDALNKDYVKVDARLKHIEAQLESAPTRQELQDDIAKLAARMMGMEQGQKGIERQLKTTNDYLHTLIEKAIPEGKR